MAKFKPLSPLDKAIVGLGRFRAAEAELRLKGEFEDPKDPVAFFRVIDRSLQRLRKAGYLKVERQGRSWMWHETPEGTTARLAS